MYFHVRSGVFREDEWILSCISRLGQVCFVRVSELYDVFPGEVRCVSWGWVSYMMYFQVRSDVFREGEWVIWCISRWGQVCFVRVSELYDVFPGEVRCVSWGWVSYMMYFQVRSGVFRLRWVDRDRALSMHHQMSLPPISLATIWPRKDAAC